MTTQDERSDIIDESDLRKYRTELPNLYDDAGLDPYEFRLLAHYKRVGTCREALRTTAEKCSMSHPTVIEKRKSLADKGWISLSENHNGNVVVKVVDKWVENFRRYAPRSGSLATNLVARLPKSGSLVYPKKELKKELIKNTELHPLAVALATVTGLNFTVETNRKRCFATAKNLSRAVPAPTGELILSMYECSPGSYWHDNDWRGRKGQRPTLASVEETWGGWSITQPVPSTILPQNAMTPEEAARLFDPRV